MPAAVPKATVRPDNLVWQTLVSSNSTAANRSWAPRLQFEAVNRSCLTASLRDFDTLSQSSAKTASSLVLVSAYSSVRALALQASGDSSGSLVAAAARTVVFKLFCGATSAPAERAPASSAAQTLKELLLDRPGIGAAGCNFKVDSIGSSYAAPARAVRRRTGRVAQAFEKSDPTVSLRRVCRFPWSRGRRDLGLGDA